MLSISNVQQPGGGIEFPQSHRSDSEVAQKKKGIEPPGGSKPRELAPGMEFFQDRLRLAVSELKRREGLSQADVAKRIGIDGAVLSRLLSGSRYGVTLNTALLVAQRLRRPLSWFLGQDDPAEEVPDSSVRAARSSRPG